MPMSAQPNPDSAYSVDVVVLSTQPSGLAVLLSQTEGVRERTVPWDVAHPTEPLNEEARRIARAAAGVRPTWLHQVGAFGDGRRHPSGLPLTVAYVAVVPEPVEPSEGSNASWVALARLPQLAPRQRLVVEGAVELMRSRMDVSPVAFRLLPPTFTLSQLQGVYELLLGRRLHKASFRRALQASNLVSPLSEWRSEGRGRPAQLYRYAPRKARVSPPRGVRFDLLAVG